MNKKLILFLLSSMPMLYSMQGTVETTGFVSSFVPPSPTNLQQGCINERTVQPEGRRLFTIYFPPGYDPDDTNTNYPVTYWLHGGNLNNEFAVSQNIQGTLDTLINNGLIMPMIVVFPDASLDLTFRITDPTCQNFPPGDECPLIIPGATPPSYGNTYYKNTTLNNVLYEDYFIQELVPYIDANYNTIASRNFRGITGHSMGGYGALFLGMKHPETFAALAPQSATAPYTFTDNQSFDPLPPYPAYTLNSIFLPGIYKNPERKVSPCNEGLSGPVGFAWFIFVLSSVFSPNVAGGNSFLDEFRVDLPIVVNPDGTPSLIDGMFDVYDVFNPNIIMTFTQSVVLDASVVDRWKTCDPFFLLESHLDTLEKQAIYFDGGVFEPWNNIGAQQMSDILMTNTVDNTYILYCGNHDTFLFTPNDSRQTQIFRMFSGQFSTAGTCPQEISSKLIGNITIELCDDAKIEINNGSILSVQTTRLAPIIEQTNVLFQLKDNAAIHIGTSTTQGGALQIGDPFTKAQLQLSNTGPFTPLADHVVDCTICLDGIETLFEVGQEGFFGIGMGINGKSNNNLALSPNVANFWSVTSLANVQNANILINKGTFSHQSIASGDEEPASLMGLDLCQNYRFLCNAPCARCLGGGNVICTVQDPINNPVCVSGPMGSIGNTGSENVNRQIRLLHPTMFNIANNLPRSLFGFTLTQPAGIINKANFNPGVTEPYFDNDVSSSTMYTNIINRGILKSTPEFDVGSVVPPYSITTDNLDELCDFLLADRYEAQPVKLANLSPTPETKIAYLQNASFMDQVAFESGLISRPSLAGASTIVDELTEEMFQTGVAGIQLEFNGTNADIPDKNITNVKQLISVYNAHAKINT